MKSVIDWIKSNVLADVAIVVAILSVGILIYVPIMQGGQFREEVEKRDSKIRNLRNYSNQTVDVPSEDPNLPPETKTGITANEWVINELQQIRQKMDSEAEKTFELVVGINRQNHQLMLEGMLPSPDNRFQVLKAYRDEYMPLFLSGYNPDSPHIGLSAGLPPREEELAEKLSRVYDEFLGSGAGYAGAADEGRRAGRTGRGGRGAGAMPGDYMMGADPRLGGGPTRGSSSASGGTFNLAPFTADDRKTLRDSLTRELRGMLVERAESIHVYADPRMWIQGTGTTPQLNPNFPMDVQPWAIDPSGRPPTPAEIFEGQLEYWIQQDLIKAVALANRVDDPASNVLNAPVKRLIRVEVLPGYVGLHSGGAMDTDPGGSTSTAGGWTPPSNTRNVTTNARQLLYSPPPPNAIGDPSKPLSENFYVAPTGRVSNALYDVRHARLTVVVDATRLDELLSAIASVNLMTVIDMTIQDVDEYRALREQRFLYAGDAVQADIVIETIWLRDWTTQFMPEDTKVYLGIKPPARAAGAGEGEGAAGSTGYQY